MLKFWRSHGPGTTLGLNASETAPGVFFDTPAVFVHSVYGGKVPPAQADLLKRWRESGREDETLLRALVASVNGVSQGVQNTG